MIRIVPYGKPVRAHKVTETVADDEDVHLQSAHDAIRSRIAKHRREGKDTKALEGRLASIAALISKKV